MMPVLERVPKSRTEIIVVLNSFQELTELVPVNEQRQSTVMLLRVR